jgi:hypothetical protein
MRIEGGRGLWDGRYDLAAGQEVTREDALSLAIALQSVQIDDSRVKELVSFCRRSGFLITGPNTASVAQDLANLSVAVEAERSEPSTAFKRPGSVTSQKIRQQDH